MCKSVFFSWQSDVKARIGRNFIISALKQALKELTRDPEIEMPDRDFFVERDTAGIPGTPPIVDTIFSKIDNAFAFVPDLTFVGTRGDGKPTPNPNVLIEYGWATKSLGYKRLIPVMNTAYGNHNPENMPFDIRHLRNPITFYLPEDSSEEMLALAKSRLVNDFKCALRLILESQLLNNMNVDHSFGADGVAILPEVCFTPQNIHLDDDGGEVLIAGFVDGIPHIARLTPGGHCCDPPLSEQVPEESNKIHHGLFLFFDNKIYLAGIPGRPCCLMSQNTVRAWKTEDIIYDLILAGTESFTGWLRQGRVLIMDEERRIIRLQIDQDVRFIHEGCHSIRRQGDSIYLYWVPPQLHHAFVSRFDLDGHLDQTFGDQGIVQLPTEYGPRGRVLNFLNVTDLCVQPDGKILVAGYGNDANVVRLLPNGSRDDSFGPNGGIVFRADFRSSLTRLIYTDKFLYAFGDQNSGNISSHYLAKIDHQGKFLGHLTFKGKGQSAVVNAVVSGCSAFILCHFNADAPMHSCAVVYKVRI